MQDLIDEILKLSTKDKFPFYFKSVITNITIKIINITKVGILCCEDLIFYRVPFNRLSKDTLTRIKDILITKNNDLWND